MRAEQKSDKRFFEEHGLPKLLGEENMGRQLWPLQTLK